MMKNQDFVKILKIYLTESGDLHELGTKGRDCRDFFCELEKRLVNEENMVLKSRASERLLAISPVLS